MESDNTIEVLFSVVIKRKRLGCYCSKINNNYSLAKSFVMLVLDYHMPIIHQEVLHEVVPLESCYDRKCERGNIREEWVNHTSKEYCQRQ